MDGVGVPKNVASRPVAGTKRIDRPIEANEENFGQLGTGKFVNEITASISHEKSNKGAEIYTLNLVNAPIEQAARKILGDIMGYTFSVDPRVKGDITLQTSNPVSRESLMDILEAALAANDAAILARNGRYDIVPAAVALATTPDIRTSAIKAAGPGMRLQVVQLRYISAADMQQILEPITRPGSIIRVDTARNYLLVAGNGGELSAISDAVNVFDVDRMKGMSVALYPLKTSKPEDVARELDAIFGVSEGGSKTIQFLPNSRLRSVLAISARPEFLTKASGWIRKLDRLAETNEEQLFVYEIQNRPAKELAAVLQSVLGSGMNTQDQQGAVAPNLTPVAYATGEGEAAPPPSMPVASGAASIASVVPDIERNALLISATPKDYRRIERILQQLDVMPTQVFLEAIIAEVTLTDQLKFGMNWYFGQKHDGLTFSDLSSGAMSSSFPGFSWTGATGDMQAVLNAVSSVTKVKVISSPSLMVINNQKATLQVGDQVPVVTQSAANTGTSNVAIVNSVELKDTGIILSVTPRINSSGRVMLDIEQEVSNVVETTTSGIDSPTIQQRKIATRVMINDGESLALGGLIQEKNARTEKKLPVLGDVPLLGNAFKSKSDTLSRTELVIFIRPRVVRDSGEARQITEEFRAQFDFGASETPRRKIQRDLNRLVQ